MTGISTQTLNSFTMRSALLDEASYATVEEQESSGLTSETLGGLGSQTSSLLDLQDELSTSQSYASEATSVGDKVQSMYSSIGEMITQVTNLETTLSSAIEGSTSGLTTSTLNTDGSDALTALSQYMNTQYENSYLFSGSATNTEPVNLTSYAPTAATTTADTSYYAGNDTTASVKVSSDQTVSYGVTADNSAFEQALRAAYIVSTADISDTSDLKSALSLAQGAITALSSLQQNVSLSATQLTTAATNQTSAITYLTTSVSNIKDVDTAAVAAQVTLEQSNLSASYDAIAKVAKLSLSTYL